MNGSKPSNDPTPHTNQPEVLGSLSLHDDATSTQRKTANLQGLQNEDVERKLSNEQLEPTDSSNAEALFEERNPTAKTTDKAVRRGHGHARRNRGVAQERSKRERDGLIMDTNNSSIVSKRSVEKLYFPGQTEYFRHFVSKFKRRAPLINRGYWLRMRAVEHAVIDFLTERPAEKKLVVNLGCGYDPLPFMILGRRPEICSNTIFLDVDYPELMRTKVKVVDGTDQIRALIPNFTRTTNEIGLLGSAANYAMIACDLINTKPLQQILRDEFRMETSEIAILFVSEVATAYMEREASQAVFEWAATYPDSRFVLLEQHVPDGVDHPFAQTMMAHFEKLRTPLRAVGTMEQMRQRFITAGFSEQGTDIRSLWELWSDSMFLTAEEREALDHVEPFDEWEEFALYASHYFLLVADKKARHTKSQSELLSTPLTPDVSTRELESASNAIQEISKQRSSLDDGLYAHQLPDPHDFRRFTAIIPSPTSDDQASILGLHGGMGSREREESCNTYATVPTASAISPPPLRSGIMCHTITKLGNTSDCLLVGGRTAPDKASVECWARQGNIWREVAALPSGRFRHSAVPIVIPSDAPPTHTVLLFGGKSSDGAVSDEWLISSSRTRWQSIPVIGDSPPARFGAAMATDGLERTSGILVGGMNRTGCVLNDFWHWELMPDLTLRCQNMTVRATSLLQSNACILGRFGAQLVRSASGMLLIGGVAGGRMLTRNDEVLNLDTFRPRPIHGPRPLLIGSSIETVDEGLLVLGGGATCFSFGTTWNRSSLINDAKPGSVDTSWRLRATEVAGKPITDQQSYAGKHNGIDMKGGPKPVQIPRLSISPEVSFAQFVEARKPVVFTECNLGRCTSVWNSKYLKDKVGAHRLVSVHMASTEKMDFQTKNFEYKTQEFGTFLDTVDRGERVYLRSLSSNAPSDKPTRLSEDFAEIAGDFDLPPELSSALQHEHSSPLRISGPVQMWLHYDVMANVLCQVRGMKRVILFPPSDVTKLQFEPGASSSSLDVFGALAMSEGQLAETHPVEITLQPGDILLIPPMWIHATAPKSDSSIAVNVFFRDFQSGYAAGRDVYGNRDLAAYEKGRKDVAKIMHTFDGLPKDVAGFYLERLAMEMLDRARTLSRSAVSNSAP